tara:strand:- start:88139 stop:89155 length:1017 start_codon:yes stop_codon:yes gene_type:complete
MSNSENTDETSDKIKKKYPISNQLTDNVELNDLSFVWNVFDNKPSKISLYSIFDGGEFWTLLQKKIGDIDNEDKYTTCNILTESNSIIYNYKYLIKINNDIYLSLYEYLDDNSHTINNLSFYYNNEEINIEDINEYINVVSMSLIDQDKESKLNYLIYEQGKLELEPVENKFKFKVSKDGDFYDLYPDDIRLEMHKIIKNIDKNKNGIYCIYGENNRDKKHYMGYIIDQTEKNVVIVPYNMVESFLSSLELTEILNRHPNTLFIIDSADGLFRNGNGLSGLLQIIKGSLKHYISANFLFIYDTSKKSDIPTKIIENSSNNMDFIHFDSIKGNDNSSYY